MDQSKTVALTKKLLREYYEFGNIVDLRRLFTDDVVAFGIKSENYEKGPKAVEQFLRKMHRAMEACRVNKMSCTAKTVEDGITVRVNVVFSTNERMRNMQQVLVMYRETAMGWMICGLHFQRDVHHELTYQMVSSRMLNQGEAGDGCMDEVVDMVSSYVNCAYVQYRPDTQLPMDYFSDELWRMLGYGSDGEFSASFQGYLEHIVHEQDLGPSRDEIRRQLHNEHIMSMEEEAKKILAPLQDAVKPLTPVEPPATPVAAAPVEPASPAPVSLSKTASVPAPQTPAPHDPTLPPRAP